ncbi:MAG: hypothetical protein ACRYFZ_25880 [Janthinobacterium lividum]
MTKEQVLIALQALPDPFEPEQFIERLIALRDLDEGLEQIKRGEVVTVEEAKFRLRIASFLKERLIQSDNDEIVSFEEAYRCLSLPEKPAL